MSNGRLCGYGKPHGTNVQVYRTIVFHYRYHCFDARRRLVGLARGQGLPLASCASPRTKTREIIGTYKIKYKPAANNVEHILICDKLPRSPINAIGDFARITPSYRYN